MNEKIMQFRILLHVFLIVALIKKPCRVCCSRKTVMTTVSPKVKEMDFNELTKTDYFVDKTALIRLLFDAPKYHYITHPHGFGKSVNLRMIRDFLQFNVDNVTRREIEDKTMNKNYKLFKDTLLNLEVSRDEAFFVRHFGEYPVLYLDFSHITGNSAEEVVAKIRIEVQKMCQTYHYFKDWLQQKLNSTTKFERNLGERYFEPFSKLLRGDAPEKVVIQSVRMLSEFIGRHFTKKPILLVDGLDNPIMHSIKIDIDFGDVYFVINSMFSPLFEGIDRASYALLTGISRMVCATASSEIMELKYYSFWEGNKYARYFGLTEEEVSSLCDKYKIRADERATMKEFFGGYYVLGKSMSMYNTRDVVNYLRNRSFMEYQVDNETRSEVVESVRISKVRKEVISLLGHKEIECEVETNASIYQLHLFVLFTQRKPEKYDPVHFACTHYLENGYLTPVGEKKYIHHVLKITNLKARLEFKYALYSFYIAFNLDLREHAVIRTLREIAECEKTTKQSLQKLQTDIDSIFDGFNQMKMMPRLFLNKMEIFSIIQSIVVYNNDRARIDVAVRKVEEPSNTENTFIANILIPSRNGDILLMMKIMYRNTTEEALRQIASCVPVDGVFNATVIKYVAINFDANNKVDVQDGANLYRNHS